MKRKKRIFTWITFSLIIQILGFIYIDKIFLSENTSLTSKKVTKKDTLVKKDIDISIPKEAENIKLSFDGTYVSYYIDDELKIINTKTSEENEIFFDQDETLQFYKWLPDRNRMLIAEKHNSNKGDKLSLFYYDKDKDAKEKIKDLTWADENSKVEDIQYSIFTNVIDVKVLRGEKRSDFYWIDINTKLKNLYLNSDYIGKIAILNNEDKLVYEDKTYNKIYSTGIKGSIKIENVHNSKLLGVDNDDNIYIGSLENEKISKIYYGSLDSSTSEWKIVNLKNAENPENIFMLPNGKLVINDILKGVIKETTTEKEYSYSGKFIQFYSTGIASIKDGRLIKTYFNQN